MSTQNKVVSLDLVTGFLGSGKTTFMKYYISHLLEKEKVAIIVNDFGAINVDMMMLKELRSSNCEIEMVTAADEDCYKRRLKTKLISLCMQGFKHVVIEPSGIFDINLFLDIIHDETLEKWYQLNSVIGIIDPTVDYHDEMMSSLLIDEIINAGVLVLSKVQLVDETIKQSVLKNIDSLLNKHHVCLSDYQIIDKPWDLMKDTDYNYILNGGYKVNQIIKSSNHDYQSLFFFNLCYTKYELTLKLQKILENQKIKRIKGFMTLQEGYLVSVNVTENQFVIEPIKEGQEVLIIIGEALDESYIKSVLS